MARLTSEQIHQIADFDNQLDQLMANNGYGPAEVHIRVEVEEKKANALLNMLYTSHQLFLVVSPNKEDEDRPFFNQVVKIGDNLDYQLDFLYIAIAEYVKKKKQEADEE